MNDRDAHGPDVHGPIDTLILEFPASSDAGATAQALRDLVDRGTVRLYDLMVVTKGSDGGCVEVDLGSSSDGRLGALREFAGARSGLLGTDDLAALGDILEPGTVGVALVYENAWAVPFVAAARGAGADVVASSRITALQVMELLDAAEASV